MFINHFNWSENLITFCKLFGKIWKIVKNKEIATMIKL